MAQRTQALEWRVAQTIAKNRSENHPERVYRVVGVYGGFNVLHETKKKGMAHFQAGKLIWSMPGVTL